LDGTVHFPPLIAPVKLREREDAFAQAIAAASAGGEAHRGAGTLFYVGRFELIEFALVLEPEEPLRLARKIFYAGMNALADTLSMLAPPEKPITFRYPDALCFDGALVGGARLGVPADATEDMAPDWLVFGAMVRAGGLRISETGLMPEITTLDDEGFEAWEPAEFSASFARHFMVAVDAWHEGGMRRIAPDYLARLEGKAKEVRHGIDENGDLLIDATTGRQRTDFTAALRRAQWYDPLLNEPRSDLGAGA